MKICRMCWKIWPDEFDKCRNDGCTEFFKDSTEFVNSILQLRILKIKSLEAKITRIKEETDKIRMTGIPSSLDKHTEKMHVELNAQMKLVKAIETILD